MKARISTAERQRAMESVDRAAWYATEVESFVHATIDKAVAVLPPDGLLERVECLHLWKTLYGTRKASERWQQYHTRVLKRFGCARAQ